MKMIQTYNQHVVKKGNKSLVLQTIQEFTPISRADIANKTGLNKGTVSSQVSELLKENLILESGPGVSSGGRRPVMLLFNQVAGYSIGVDIGVNYILGILTDLQGNICQEQQVQFHDLNYEEIKLKLFSIVESLINSMPKSPYGLVGIGIGVPGTVSTDGEILLAPNLNWKNINLKETMEEKYKVPVQIENEANAGACGEKKFGAGKDLTNIIYVSVGIGIGTGLILNGELFKGNNGFSGELGHMTIEADGPECRCGNKGCWELYASEKALIQSAEQDGIQAENGRKLSLEALNELAENGDAKVIKVFEGIGEYLGTGITNIINIFNPEQVIIGNRLASSSKWLEEPIIKKQHHSLFTHQKDLSITFSQLSTHAAALGMAAYASENFLTIDIQEV
ncbi:ROK family transcriptional regulator [Metabacillus idriensis]|uniref:ROK family protein n=1 Tax=Metabacillus idriensis TaxID=324768 RepID=A0A6I2MEX1_9BACI|nr:ROK family protein [Metabacillus idriensis]MCM3597101.1 ROK family transcriptional regulator [Metabacillus idriensis]MRX55586.1 ROK family protein [Metabacillus idriensis]OHR67372.1 ROK family protein [Bacillus sp. HMSC76G11]